MPEHLMSSCSDVTTHSTTKRLIACGVIPTGICLSSGFLLFSHLLAAVTAAFLQVVKVSDGVLPA